MSETSAALRFGFPPSEPDSAKRRDAAELARQLHLDVAFGTDYRSLVDDLVAGQLDAAWLAPLSLLRGAVAVRPVLSLRRAGRVSFHGALIARRDSGLVGIRDLKGLSVGWVDRDSAAGYVLTRALIAEQRPDVDGFLGPQQILGSHRAVVEAVVDGRVQVGATFVNFGAGATMIGSGWQELLGDRASEVGAIAITGSIPGDVIAVRQSLAEADTAALVAALRARADDDAGRALIGSVFGAEGFDDPRPGEHDLLARQAERAGWRASPED